MRIPLAVSHAAQGNDTQIKTDLALGDIPDLDGAVPRRRRKHAAVRVEIDACHVPLVALKPAHQLQFSAHNFAAPPGFFYLAGRYDII